MVYSVIIRTSLESKGLRTGEREAKTAFDNIAREAEKASQREIKAQTNTVRAVESLQRQRSSALIAQYRAEERAAEQAERRKLTSFTHRIQLMDRAEARRTQFVQQSIRAEQRAVEQAERQKLTAFTRRIQQIDRAEQGAVRQRESAIKREQQIFERAEREKTRTAQRASQEQVRAAEHAATRKAAAAQKATQLMIGAFNVAKVAILGVFAALSAAAIGLGAVIQRAMRMENLQLSLKVVAGSAEEAQIQLKRLTELARLPGLGFSQAIDASIKLQIGFQTAIKETQTRVALAEEVLREFSNAIALTGGGPEVFERVITQITQMSVAGKVLMTDLRPIITQAPALGAALQKAFGTISPEEINALGLSTEEFMRRWLKALAEMERAPDTATNAIVNFLNTLDIAIAKVGAPFLAPLRDALNSIEPLAEKAGIRLGQIFEQVTKDAGQLWANLPESTKAAFQDMFDTVRGFGKLITDWIRDNYPLMKDAVVNVLNQIGKLWNEHGEQIKTGYESQIKTVLDLAKAGLNILKGDWEAAGKAIARALEDQKPRIVAVVKFFVSAAIDAITEGIPRLRVIAIELGKAIAEGVWLGIKQSDIGVRITGWAQGLVNAARLAVNAHSPSRDFYDLGRDIAEGLRLGIESGQQSVQQSIVALTDVARLPFTTRDRTVGNKPQEDAAKRITDELTRQSQVIAELAGKETQVQRINRLLTDPNIAKLINERTASILKQNAAIEDSLAAAQGQTRDRFAGPRGQIRERQVVDDVTLQVTRAYANIIDDLNGSLREHVQLSRVEITLQKLQAAGLDDLTDARVQEALALAQVIDQQDALNESQARIDDWASEVSDIFGRAAYHWDLTFKGFFKSVGQGFLDMFRRIFADAVQSTIFKGMQSIFSRIFTPQAGGGGGGGIGGFVSNLIGGFGGTSNSATSFGGGLAGIFGGAGIGSPSSLSGQNETIQQIAAIAQGNPLGGGGGGGLLASLGAMGPLLGASLGFGIGSSFGRGASPLASILGGVGLGAVGLVGGSAISALLAGSFAGFTALGAATLGIGAVLAVGAYLIGRNAQRRKNEEARNELSLQVIAALEAMLADARSGQLTQSAAATAFEQLRVQYFDSISGFDSKTKRIATEWWNRPEHPPQVFWKKIQEAARQGEHATQIASQLVPEFATGGLVPYMGRGSTLIKVRPGERIDDVGLRESFFVPGLDRGRDEVLTLATPGSAVRTRSQQAMIPGFAQGTDAPIGVIQLTIDRLNIDLNTGQIVAEGMRTSDGRKATIKTIRAATINGELKN